jgi:hypothetical protein
MGLLHNDIVDEGEAKFTWGVRGPGKGLISVQSLGAEGVLPGRHIESLLRVFKQFAHLIPSGQMLSSFKTYSPL